MVHGFVCEWGNISMEKCFKKLYTIYARCVSITDLRKTVIFFFKASIRRNLKITVTCEVKQLKCVFSSCNARKHEDECSKH